MPRKINTGNLVEFRFAGENIFSSDAAPAEVISDLNEITDASAEVIAKISQRLMMKWLSPGHTYNIGASGAASQNLEVRRLSGGKGSFSYWGVAEVGRTKANPIIRTGFGAGSWPSIETLRKWAATKPGVHLRLADTEIKFQTISAYGTRGSSKQKAHVKSGHAKAAWGQADKATLALERIRFALYYLGSANPKGNWFLRSPWPKHTGRFDYPSFLAKQFQSGSAAETLRKAIRDIDENVYNVVMRLIYGGRKQVEASAAGQRIIDRYGVDKR